MKLVLTKVGGHPPAVPGRQSQGGRSVPRSSILAILIAALLLPGQILAQDVLLEIDGNPFEGLRTVSRAGDLNGDGVMDLVTGSPAHDKMRVHSGQTGDVLLDVAWLDDSSFGFWSDGAGDFDADGTPDIVVGAPGDDTMGTNKGAAFVISGTNGAVLATFYGEFFEEEFGYQVAGIGDVNDDGYDDVAVGAGYHRRVRIYGGPDGHLIRFHVKENGNRRPSIASIGDVTQDGVPDYVIGWPTDNTGGTLSGTVVLFSGRGGTPVYERYGPTSQGGGLTGSALGMSVAGLGDVDGDGFPDFVAGAPGDWDPFSGGPASQAAAYVYSGKGGEIIFEWTHADFVDEHAGHFGRHVSGGGDVNADGVPDILVGARSDGPGKTGSVSAFSGATGERLWRALGATFDSRLHHSALIPDVNGDGLDDFAVADGGAEFGGTSAGRITVYAGAPGELEHACSDSTLAARRTMHLSTFGAIGIGNNFLTLRCHDAPPNGIGIFVYGPPSPRLPMSGGWLCTGPPSYQLAPPLPVDPRGFVEHQLDFTQPPLSSGPGQVVPGATWSFQLYGRDLDPAGAGPRISDALAITFPP